MSVTREVSEFERLVYNSAVGDIVDVIDGEIVAIESSSMMRDRFIVKPVRANNFTVSVSVGDKQQVDEDYFKRVCNNVAHGKYRYRVRLYNSVITLKEELHTIQFKNITAVKKADDSRKPIEHKIHVVVDSFVITGMLPIETDVVVVKKKYVVVVK